MYPWLIALRAGRNRQGGRMFKERQGRGGPETPGRGMKKSAKHLLCAMLHIRKQARCHPWHRKNKKIKNI
jgi:hypothetical protein